MKYTGNLNLKKPEGTDTVNIDDFNDNADILDVAVTRVATPTQDGRMARTDKSKLDGIEAGANKYDHPAEHPAAMITETTTRRFVSDAEKANWNTKETPDGAQAKVNTHANRIDNPHGVTKAQVGLGNVENVQQATKEEFTAHLADDASLTEKGHVQLSDATDSTSTSMAATPNAVKKAYDRAEQAFTSASNGKALIGTAITGVDGNVTVPTDPTFQQLADAIGSISTGKKWASGISTVSTSARQFYSSATSYGTYYYIQVEGLDFKPRYIIWHAYLAGRVAYNVGSFLDEARNEDGYKITSGNRIVNEVPHKARAHVEYGGFLMPTATTRPYGDCYWVAIE